MANSSEVLSAITLGVHRALGPEHEEGGILWSLIHPVWVALLLLPPGHVLLGATMASRFGPMTWFESVLALPRSLILAARLLLGHERNHALPGALRLLSGAPIASWRLHARYEHRPSASCMPGMAASSVIFLLQSLFSPTLLAPLALSSFDSPLTDFNRL